MDQKKSEPDQKFPETEQFFLVDHKKGDQETDQNHMDGTIVNVYKVENVNGGG